MINITKSINLYFIHGESLSITCDEESMVLIACALLLKAKKEKAK